MRKPTIYSNNRLLIRVGHHLIKIDYRWQFSCVAVNYYKQPKYKSKPFEIREFKHLFAHEDDFIIDN